MNDLVETLLHVVVGVIIAVSVIHVSGFILNTPIPIVAVESNSMCPETNCTFAKGDILIIQGVPEDELKVSDIIVFSVPGQTTPVVHRIIKINSDGTFQTQGDANNGQLPFEKSIKYEQVLGKQIFPIPLLGWVKIILVEHIWPDNIIWVILISLIIVFIYFIRQ